MNQLEPASESATVFVVDDDATSLKVICELAKSVGLATKTYKTAAEFLNSYLPSERGCLVTDLRLPDLSGLQLIEEMRQRHGFCPPTIVISAYADVPTAVDAMKRGAIDFLEKPVPSQTLVDCVQAAIRMDQRRRARQHDAQAVRDALSRLTDREREVLDHLLAGKPNKEIAFKLGVSHKTVATHRANILQKLGVSNLVELVKHLDSVMPAGSDMS